MSIKKHYRYITKPVHSCIVKLWEAVVDKNVEQHATRKVAEAFVQYLYTPEVQREFAKIGFRPVDTAIAKQLSSDFPQIKTLLKVEDLGGWNSIGQKFFSEGAIFDKIQAQKPLS
ncbi:hypothetical protein A4S05_38235 [Nostoc sp. KVJ20]|uniref:hypothetical protein n=1 Tax=Nostoc sp. KVJ20 TaxID=457944 RepID=UPI00083D9BD7|nr:hypothetical protein A4S05_38235 [Nostoc sp. KVJ20]